MAKKNSNMFELTRVLKSDLDGRIDFEYNYSNNIAKYFSKNKFYAKYSIDICEVPDEIACIPLLANLLPISWFAGFDVKVDKLDNIFYEQVMELKNQFSKYYPLLSSKVSNLIVEELVESKDGDNQKSAMLFSGGVDAYATLLRHFEQKPDLITIKGADIAVADKEQWKMVVDYNNSTPAIFDNEKLFIESNLRDFYTFQVDQLLPSLDWWGYVQFGFALTGLTAPLAYRNSYKVVHIASTASAGMPFAVRGSLPEFDNLIKWNGTQIHHDGYELSRFDKVETILRLGEKYKIDVPLRVCYHDIKEGLNCSECEKCCRTIIAIMVLNKNPKLYGFRVDNDIYRKIEKHLKMGFSVSTVRFYWNEIFEKLDIHSFFYLENVQQERLNLNSLVSINKEVQSRDYSDNSKSKIVIIKQQIIRKYPNSFKLYLKLRRKLL